MPDVTATEAARTFSDILDAVEHRGEHFTIVRRGRPVAELGPATSGTGRDVKSMLRRHRIDRGWKHDLVAAGDILHVEERP